MSCHEAEGLEIKLNDGYHQTVLNRLFPKAIWFGFIPRLNRRSFKTNQSEATKHNL
jgi:hypothetical protein